MELKYNINIKDETIVVRLTNLTNQIYALLPNREEGNDWVKPLETIMEELAGMERLLVKQQDLYLPLLSKLEGLFVLKDKSHYFLFRRTIFEALSLVGKIIQWMQEN